MKTLLTFANRGLDSARFGQGSHITRAASVEEVCTIEERNKPLTIHCDPVDQRRAFFPNKVGVTFSFTMRFRSHAV